MVKLNRVPGADCKATILAKLEFQNPGGSVKDRIAKKMVEDAEAAGLISPDKNTIVEVTSGNTGIGLAMVAAAKGYPCIIIMPQVPPMYERYLLCRKFGADVHLTAPAIGGQMIQNAFDYMEILLKENPSYWTPSQFKNPSNPTVHVETTGPEVWEQTGGKVDYVIAGAGTGGTINGLGRYLKEKNPDIKLICVEPTESRVLQGEESDKHTLVGIGAGVPLQFIEELEPGKPFEPGPRGIIDEFMHATSDEGMEMANRLAAEEGLLVGPSTGAACKVALEVAARPEAAGKNIVTIFPSSGIRYVMHPMWGAEKGEGSAALPMPPDMSGDPPLLRWKSEDYVPPEE